jgi:hypothetical protein
LDGLHITGCFRIYGNIQYNIPVVYDIVIHVLKTL